MALSTPSFELFADLQSEQAASPAAQAIRVALAAGTAAPGWALVDDVLLFQGWIFAPDDSILWPRLLSEAHDIAHEGMHGMIF